MVDIVQIEGFMPVSSNKKFKGSTLSSLKGRYKQYSRSEIMAAIEEVRNGKSALEASKMYRIPSRTLYDKLQKMGLTSIGRQQPEGRNAPSSDKDAIPSTKDTFQYHLAMENFVHGSRSAFDVIDAIGRHTCMFCGLRTSRRPHDEEAIQIRTLGKFSCHKCNERFHLSREIAEAHSLESQTLRRAPEISSTTSPKVATEAASFEKISRDAGEGTAPRKHKCVVCTFHTHNISSYIIHMRQEHGIKSIQSRVDQQTFKCKGQYRT